MPVFYIHVGPPKTGTSSLQKFFSCNQTEIFEQCNLYYPDAGRLPGAEDGAGWMHRELFPFPKWLENWERLKDELRLRSGADILISEENNVNWSTGVPIFMRSEYETFGDSHGGYVGPGFLSFLRKNFPEYSVKIVIALRRLDDQLKSTAHQFSKYLGKRTYKEYIELRLQHEHCIPYLSKTIETYKELVGADNVITFLYDGGNVISKFMTALDLKPPLMLQPEARDIWENQQLPPASMPYLVGRNGPQKQPPEVRVRILQHVRSAYEYPLGSGVGEEHIPELKKEVERLNALCPGYLKLFENRPVSFSWPEIDPDPTHLMQTYLLYDIMGELHKLHHDCIKISELRNILEFHFRYNFIQRVVINLYGMCLVLTGRKEAYQAMRADPAGHFLDAKHPARRFTAKILNLFGGV